MAQGSGNGAVVRMLASHHCGLSMIPKAWHHMWAEFVVDSPPCSKGFCAGPSSFLTAQKWTFPIHI